LEEFGVKMFQGDIFERLLVQEAVAGQDIVIHMACTVIPKTSNDDPYFDVMSNVGGAIHLLDASVENRVRKFVFISSGGTVYGVPEHVPIPETHPTNPECSYGITKLAIEKYLRLYCKIRGLPTCVLRLANPYGEYQRYHAVQGAIPVFCYKALKGEPIEIWGDGSVRRDFIYVGDAIEAIVRAAMKQEVVGVMNVGGGSAHSINEVLSAIDAELGRKTERIYKAPRLFDVPVNYLDITHVRKILDWAPVVGLEEGVRRMLAYIRKEEGL
jgi:UDP-glucose 4-epimerase